MQPVPTPPGPEQRPTDALVADLAGLERRMRGADCNKSADLLREVAGRLGATDAALRILNRVWTNGLEPAAWIPHGPFQVRHSEIAEALIPLGYPDPYPATPETMRNSHRPRAPGGGRRRSGRGTGRLVRGKLGNRWGQS